MRTIRASCKTKRFDILVTDWKEKYPRRKPKHFLVLRRMFGTIERGSPHNMMLAEAPLKPMPAGSKPPPVSKKQLRKSKISEKPSSNSTVCADGAQAWSTVVKGKWPPCQVEHVSPRDGQFTRIVPNVSKGARVAGTQVIDRTWEDMKSMRPCNVSSRKLNVHGTATAIVRRCLIWQWLRRVLSPGYSLWDHLGRSCAKYSKKVGARRLT